MAARCEVEQEGFQSRSGIALGVGLLAAVLSSWGPVVAHPASRPSMEAKRIARPPRSAMAGSDSRVFWRLRFGIVRRLSCERG